jgi:hypothetical protein
MQRQAWRMGRRIGIAIAGGAVTLAGAVLSVPLVPGPGLVLVLLGLAILSLEFELPRVWLARLKAKGVQLKQKIVSRKPGSGQN